MRRKEKADIVLAAFTLKDAVPFGQKSEDAPTTGPPWTGRKPTLPIAEKAAPASPC